MNLFSKTKRFFRIWFSPTLLDELEILYAAQQRTVIAADTFALSAKIEALKQRRQLAYLESQLRLRRKGSPRDSTEPLGDLSSPLAINSPPSSDFRHPTRIGRVADSLPRKT